MGEIKSALEIALEKAAKLEAPTAEERLGWKYFPEGERLANKFLKEDANLVAELSKYEGEARKVVARGAADVLARSINLPGDDYAKKMNKRAMDGLKMVKTDKVAVENVYSKIRRIFNHYNTQGEQQKQEAYERLKIDMEEKVRQAVKQQYGLVNTTRMNVESLPQFQSEWRKVQMELDLSYIKLLNELKSELADIS